MIMFDCAFMSNSIFSNLKKNFSLISSLVFDIRTIETTKRHFQLNISLVNDCMRGRFLAPPTRHIRDSFVAIGLFEGFNLSARLPTCMFKEKKSNNISRSLVDFYLISAEKAYKGKEIYFLT